MLASHALSSTERGMLWDAIFQELHQACCRLDEADLRNIHLHLETVVEIARATHSEKTEAQLIEVMESVCPFCRYQQPSGHCPRRCANRCTLYRCIRPIMDAIAKTLPSLS